MTLLRKESDTSPCALNLICDNYPLTTKNSVSRVQAQALMNGSPLAKDHFETSAQGYFSSLHPITAHVQCSWIWTYIVWPVPSFRSITFTCVRLVHIGWLVQPLRWVEVWIQTSSCNTEHSVFYLFILTQWQHWQNLSWQNWQKTCLKCHYLLGLRKKRRTKNF